MSIIDKNQLCAHRPRFKFCSESSFPLGSHVTDMGKIRETESYLIFTLTSTRMLPASSLHRRCRVHLIPVYRPVHECIDPVFAKTSPKRSFSMTGLTCMLAIPEPQLSRIVCLVYFFEHSIPLRPPWKNLDTNDKNDAGNSKLYSVPLTSRSLVLTKNHIVCICISARPLIWTDCLLLKMECTTAQKRVFCPLNRYYT